MYKLLAGSKVRRLSDGAQFPAEGPTADAQEYLGWLAAGNIPEPADPPSPPTQDQMDAAAALQYQKLLALRSMTPTQVQAWVAANVKDMAQAQDAITTLAIAVSILARRI